jgi:predicted metalloprotease with PDZ domain
MEYDGAFTTSALLLPHELLHSYIARGLKPASQDDSWIDEAFTIYYLRREGIEFYVDASRSKVDNRQFDSFYLAAAGQSPLSTRNPWSRVTQPGAYQIGVLFFEQIAAIIGEGELDKLMRELIREYGISKPITTAEFESHLVRVAGPRRDDVQKLFSFTVYGNAAGDVAELFKDVIAKLGLRK